MQISLSDTGKRFNRDWIFRKLSYQFNPGNAYAITGANGSGKSTLLQLIAGAIVASEGSISYCSGNGNVIAPEKVFTHIAIATPAQELIEEMTLSEFLAFHHQFKPFLPGLPVADIAGLVSLEHAAHKQIRYYSSGMKQRVKLAQAILSDTPCVLLDEPCSNLDEPGIRLYHSLISDYTANRLVVVSSNDRQEYSFCKHIIDIQQFK